MGTIEQFLDHEDSLVAGFHEHPFFKGFSEMSDDTLKDYLVQRWFLSRDFVPWYNVAIGKMDPESDASKLLVNIVKDEEPKGAPSHKENLITDLGEIGISKDTVLNAKPSPKTYNTVGRLFYLFRNNRKDNYELRALVTARVAGEILVAEEYRHVVPELEKRFGLKNSVFYGPHFKEDRKDSSEARHANVFTPVLANMINTDNFGIVKVAATLAYRAKMAFYDQFVVNTETSTPMSGHGT